MDCKSLKLSTIDPRSTAHANIMDINAVLDDLIDRYWNWRLLDIPEFATFVGVHEYDDRLMDLSLNGYLRRRDDARTWLKEVKKCRQLTEKHKPLNESSIHLDYLEHDMETFLDGLTYETYLCPLNQIDGPHIRFPLLLSWMKKDTVEEFELILTRIRHFPRQISQMMELMNEGIRVKKTAYIKTVEPYPNALLEVSQKAVTESSLFGPFKEKPEKLAEPQWNKIVQDAKDAISNFALPAYKRLSDYMRDVYLPHTRSTIGVGTLPNGEATYEAYVRFHTDKNVTANQMYDLGHFKLKELLAKLDEEIAKLGYKGTRREFIQYLRTDPKFAFKTREEMMEHYEKESERVYNLLPNIFTSLPNTPYKIIPAPSEVEKEYVAGAYIAGALEKDRPGLFILNTFSPRSRKRYDVYGIILHEALPGHHIQLALTAESGLKDYRRFADELRYWDLPAHVGMKSAYHEGWATYAEYLGHELGLYKDAYDYIGSLSRELELACRLVVDVGLHLYGWSQEEAFKFMCDNCICDELEIQVEVERYISLPAQSIGYFYGCKRFKELRQKAETALCEAFDVRTFHDMLASLGDVPMTVVEGQVDKYINDRSEMAA